MNECNLRVDDNLKIFECVVRKWHRLRLAMSHTLPRRVTPVNDHLP